MLPVYLKNTVSFSMKIAIIYASNSGSTYLAADLVGQKLKRKHNVVLKKASETTPDDLQQFDLVILGSSTWYVDNKEGMPQEYMLSLLKQMETFKKFPEKYAVFGCGSSSFTVFCGAVDYIDEYLKTHSHQVFPSLKVDNYYFDIVRNNKQIVKWSEELLKTI